MSQNQAIAETTKIPMDKIKPSPYQPRMAFDLEDIKGSIVRDGILVPLTVREKDALYELVDGERRWRTAKELGYETVPCTIINIDDDTARQMVWKVNTLRKDYAPKEKANFFKKMLAPPYGMSLKGIAREYDQSTRTVKAYLNVFKLPDDYQQMVWDKIVPIGIILELESLFNGIEYSTPKDNPEIFSILDRARKEKGFDFMQARESLKPYLAKLRDEQVERAREALEKVEPEVRVPETPEELEKAARVLRREAKRRGTPKQICEENKAKAMKTKDNIIRRLNTVRELTSVEDYWSQLEALETVIEETPSKALSALKALDKRLQTIIKTSKEEEIKRRIEEEAEKRAKELAEVERIRIEEEAKKKAKDEILTSPESMREIVETYQKGEMKREMELSQRPYKTLEIPLQTQYQNQRIWNLKQLIRKDLSSKAKDFHFDFVTLGYSQKTMEAFCSSLKEAGVTLLIDVRRNPRSMYRTEFNKDTLREELRKEGIDYEHVPELGIPREMRNRAYNEEITSSELFELYSKQILTNEKLERLQKIAEPHHTFAIMCTEVDPTMCHRHKIAQALTQRARIGYDL